MMQSRIEERRQSRWAFVNPEVTMVIIKSRSARAGSLALVVATASISFAFFSLLTLGDSVLVPGVLAILCATLLEAARRIKLRRLRVAARTANQQDTVRIEVGGVKVGEISESLYATMRLVAASDPRNYLAQFVTVSKWVAQHVVLTLAVTPAFILWWFVAEALFAPDAFVSMVKPLATMIAAAASGNQALDVAAMASLLAGFVLHASAIVGLVLAALRMMAGSRHSIENVFRADLERRIRLLLVIPPTGQLAFIRSPAARLA